MPTLSPRGCVKFDHIDFGLLPFPDKKFKFLRTLTTKRAACNVRNTSCSLKYAKLNKVAIDALGLQKAKEGQYAARGDGDWPRFHQATSHGLLASELHAARSLHWLAEITRWEKAAPPFGRNPSQPLWWSASNSLHRKTQFLFVGQDLKGKTATVFDGNCILDAVEKQPASEYENLIADPDPSDEAIAASDLGGILSIVEESSASAPSNTRNGPSNQEIATRVDILVPPAACSGINEEEPTPSNVASKSSKLKMERLSLMILARSPGIQKPSRVM